MPRSLRDQFSQRVLFIRKARASHSPRVNPHNSLCAILVPSAIPAKLRKSTSLFEHQSFLEPANIRTAFNMPPPTAAGSAHFNAPELTSGVPSAPNPQEIPQDPVTSEVTTAQPSVSSAAEASSDDSFLSSNLGPDYFLEVYKRRRIVHNPTVQRLSQQHLARASFDSDSVRALFNSEPSAITSNQAQVDRNASMRVPFMATGFGPGVFHNNAG